MDYINTPFYETLPEVKYPSEYSRNPASNCTRFPQKNFRPYQLFALRTRLQPLIDKKFGLKPDGGARYIVRFERLRINDRLEVVIRLHHGIRVDSSTDGIAKLNSADYDYVRSAVNWIIGHEPDLSLLINKNSQFITNILNDNDQSMISNCWSSQIIEFLSLHPILRPHIRPADRYQTAGLYIDLSRRINYRQDYNDIYLNVVRSINKMYNDGLMPLSAKVDLNRLNRWEVKSVGLNIPLTISEDNDASRKALYRATWKDKRLTDPVGGMIPFLEKHLVRNNKKILLDIEDDGPLIRHKISRGISGLMGVDKYIFRGTMLEVEVEDLKSAQIVADMVDRSKFIPVGRVVTIYANDPRQFNTFLLSFPSSDSKLRIDMRGYRVDDSSYLYCLSCHIPLSGNPSFYYKALNRWYNRVINQVSTEPLIKAKSIVKPSIELPSIKPATEPTISKRPTITLPKMEIPYQLFDNLGKKQQPIPQMPSIPEMPGKPISISTTPMMASLYNNIGIPTMAMAA